MTVLHRQYSPIHERISAKCSHSRSGIVRGVVSEIEMGTSKILPVGNGPTPGGIKRSGLPAYLTNLDEPLIDYAFANFIASINKENKPERAKTDIVSAIMCRAFQESLR